MSVSVSTMKAKLVAAWGGRAKIRRNLTVAVADAAALVVAFQVAFPEVGVAHAAEFSLITRTLAGIGVWLASKAVTAIVDGRSSGDETEPPEPAPPAAPSFSVGGCAAGDPT